MTGPVAAGMSMEPAARAEFPAEAICTRVLS